MGTSVTGVRLALADPFQAPRIVRDLAESLGGGYYVSDWTRVHRNFFRSIEITKSMLFVILLLVVAVAAFNIVAALVMVVKDKREDIAILRTLGAAPAQCARGVFDPGRVHRAGRHGVGRGARAAAVGQSGVAGARHSSTCSARISSTPRSTS